MDLGVPPLIINNNHAWVKPSEIKILSSWIDCKLKKAQTIKSHQSVSVGTQTRSAVQDWLRWILARTSRSAQVRASDDRAWCWNIGIPYNKRAFAPSSYALTYVALKHPCRDVARPLIILLIILVAIWIAIWITIRTYNNINNNINSAFRKR